MAVGLLDLDALANQEYFFDIEGLVKDVVVLYVSLIELAASHVVERHQIHGLYYVPIPSFRTFVRQLPVNHLSNLYTQSIKAN